VDVGLWLLFGIRVCLWFSDLDSHFRHDVQCIAFDTIHITQTMYDRTVFDGTILTSSDVHASRSPRSMTKTPEATSRRLEIPHDVE